MSLDEIAVRFGVSRERVRQILCAHGGPDPRTVTQARRRRAEQRAEARVDKLLLLWRGGEDPGSIASRFVELHDRDVQDRDAIGVEAARDVALEHATWTPASCRSPSVRFSSLVLPAPGELMRSRP